MSGTVTLEAQLREQPLCAFTPEPAAHCTQPQGPRMQAAGTSAQPSRSCCDKGLKPGGHGLCADSPLLWGGPWFPGVPPPPERVFVASCSRGDVRCIWHVGRVQHHERPGSTPCPRPGRRWLSKPPWADGGGVHRAHCSVHGIFSLAAATEKITTTGDVDGRGPCPQGPCGGHRGTAIVPPETQPCTRTRTQGRDMEAPVGRAHGATQAA